MNELQRNATGVTERHGGAHYRPAPLPTRFVRASPLQTVAASPPSHRPRRIHDPDP